MRGRTEEVGGQFSLESVRGAGTLVQVMLLPRIRRATVGSHVAAILRKLRVSDRDAAVRLLDFGG